MPLLKEIIPFNKPYLSGNELIYIQKTISNGQISGNGEFTKKCQSYFEKKNGFKKCLLTTSCTDALEMAAILIDVRPGDEIIMPSYTFVSTANAFVLRGAKIIFIDSEFEQPNMDVKSIEPLITSKTKAIVPVHYAGVACDMDTIMELSIRYNLFVIEDAAQAIDSYYIGKDGVRKPLGSIGHLSAFSFHETKNIISGEGGMLVINDDRFKERAEIIWEKGTNRNAFFRGNVNKYGWVDIGSSFLPSEFNAAFLWGQFENIDRIQKKRLLIWELYDKSLNAWCDDLKIRIPFIPKYATNNAHMFYLICQSVTQRNYLMEHLKKNDIYSVFHYQSLHQSEFYKNKHDGRVLKYSDLYSDTLVRLPLFYELQIEQQQRIIDCLHSLPNI